MLQGTPSRRDVDDACAAFGIDPQRLGGPQAAHDDNEGFDLWPEHATPVAIFIRMAGQWRMGPGGPIALDYNALPVVCAALRIKPGALRQAFEPIREMEAEALRWFAEQRG